MAKRDITDFKRGNLCKVERFSCPICGYITESAGTLEEIKKTGICPACQNGKIKSWTKKNDPKEYIHKC